MSSKTTISGVPGLVALLVVRVVRATDRLKTRRRQNGFSSARHGVQTGQLEYVG